MTVEFILPELGENIASGDVVSILVAAGDSVTVDQPILELETDKAIVEVPSDVSGVIKELLIKEGDSIVPGQTIFTLEANGESAAPASAESEEASAPEVETVKAEAPPEPGTQSEAQTEVQPQTKVKESVFVLPELGENITSGDVVSMLVAVGDTIAVDQPILELETDKAIIEVPSDVSGTVKELYIEAGKSISPGDRIMLVSGVSASAQTPTPAPEPKKEPAPAPEPAEPTPAPVAVSKPEPAPPKPATSKRPGQLVPAAPSVRRFAREIGIDIGLVTGTGPGGRLSIMDVKNYARQLNQSAVETASAPATVQYVTGVEAKPLPDFTQWGEISREKMSNVRRATAVHLSGAWQAPHVTQFDKADITELEALRKKHIPQVEAAGGGRLTITAIIVKVVIAALKAFPQFNASIDMSTQEIIYKNYYRIGIAVDTERGLLVPVIKEADKKSIIQISADLVELSEKARTRKTSLDDMQGGTFTITNLGGIGGTNFTPIINVPEVAILGVSRSRYEPVYNKATDEFEPRLLLPLSLSYNHQLIDGADGARFIRWVVNVLENPFMLALDN